jgi:hypothetical protein
MVFMSVLTVLLNGKLKTTLVTADCPEGLDKSSPHCEKIKILETENSPFFFTTHVLIVQTYIQGADNKLGQFLIQEIYATANRRNCLRHSLESCPSLV